MPARWRTAAVAPPSQSPAPNMRGLKRGEIRHHVERECVEDSQSPAPNMRGLKLKRCVYFTTVHWTSLAVPRPEHEGSETTDPPCGGGR